MLHRALLLLIVCFSFSSSAQAADTFFPADAGFINVRDFGAKGDGVTDDTSAIRAALTASGGDTGPTFWHDKIVYFPNGTYLVTDRIEKRYAEGRYGSGMMLMGESPENTVIKLKEMAEGYGDAAKPKAVIYTSAKLLDGNATSGGKDYTNKGEGNDAFMNFIENMTIDAGANLGAIGIDYLANNLGAIRNVIVRGWGPTGISLTRKWPGPALLQNIIIEGFDVGIDVAQTEYGITLDDIVLNNPRIVGLRNDSNVVAAHNLAINAEVALENRTEEGLIIVESGPFQETAEPFKNNGYMNLRNLRIANRDSQISDTSRDGVFFKGDKLSTSTQTWSLPVKNAPEAFSEPADKWVSVAAKPDSGEDATAAIRKAFASGAATVYFPHGIYHINDNIIIPPNVRRIVGMTSTIQVMDRRAGNFKREAGMFRVEGSGAPLTIEKLAFDHSGKGDQVAVETVSNRPLVLRDVIGAGVTTLKRGITGGEAFIENTCCGTINLAGKNGVWARQLNTEGEGVRIKNNGAPLWVLGIKTEQNCTVVENTNGASTEILGGLVYIVKPAAIPLPTFRNIDSKLYVSYAEETFRKDAVYHTHIENTQTGKTLEIKAESLPERGFGRIVPGISIP